MNRFIKIFSLTAFIAVASVATAQDQNGTSDKKDQATELTNKIDRRVKLTEEQRTQVLTLAADFLTQVNEARRDKATFADKQKEIEVTYINKMKAILTADQFVKYEELVKEYKEKK